MPMSPLFILFFLPVLPEESKEETRALCFSLGVLCLTEITVSPAGKLLVGNSWGVCVCVTTGSLAAWALVLFAMDEPC